jgi:hypothetical protein
MTPSTTPPARAAAIVATAVALGIAAFPLPTRIPDPSRIIRVTTAARVAADPVLAANIQVAFQLLKVKPRNTPVQTVTESTVIANVTPKCIGGERPREESARTHSGNHPW